MNGEWSAERKHYFEIARGPLIEIDAALDMATELSYLNTFNTNQLGVLMIRCFKMLTALITSPLNH